MRFVLIVCSGNQLNSRMYTFSFDGIVNTSLFHEVDFVDKMFDMFFRRSFVSSFRYVTVVLRFALSCCFIVVS